MPGASKWVASRINLKQYNTENPDDNIQLGTWFLNYTFTGNITITPCWLLLVTMLALEMSKWLTTLVIQMNCGSDSVWWQRYIRQSVWQLLELYAAGTIQNLPASGEILTAQASPLPE